MARKNKKDSKNMGMAASQARLLTLTARMHDIELRAQYLESQKLALATQNDEAYQKYCDAMDSKKLQIGYQDGLGMNYIDANFNSMCGFHGDEGRIRQYSLVNNMTGKVIVDEDTKYAYEEYGSDKYTFALAMMGYENNFDWINDATDGPYMNMQSSAFNVGINEDSAGVVQYDSDFTMNDNDGNPVLASTYPPKFGADVYMTEVEYIVFLKHVESDGTLKEKYMDLYNSSSNGESASKREKYLNDFRKYLYSGELGKEIIKLMNVNKNDDFSTYNDDPDNPNYDSEYREFDPTADVEFQYYVQLWEQIHEAGGCEVMDSQYANGSEGVEWLTNMVSAGLLSIYQFDPSNMSKGFELTTIATSYGNNYLQEVEDETKIKKAEAEYEHEQQVINRKDTKFDTQLKKLETEEQACKTEIDSLKKVKDENIDRTFNLFS